MTLEQRVKNQFGEFVFTVISLQAQLEEAALKLDSANKRIIELTAASEAKTDE